MRVLNDYRDQLKAGNDDPVFDPAKFADLDIDREAWTLDQPETAART
jgi:AGCS family alanine or glycine:cation symporter